MIIDFFKPEDVRDKENIKPIDKCDHPFNRIRILMEDYPIQFRCEECGIKVKPKEFEEVK